MIAETAISAGKLWNASRPAGRDHRNRIAAAVGALLIAIGLGLPAGAVSVAEELREFALAAPPPPQAQRSAVEIEQLKLSSDFTAFMDRSCPEEIRVQALRQLWRLCLLRPAP